MRWLLLVLLLFVGAAGAWWALRPDAPDAPELGLEDGGPVRPSAPRAPEPAALEMPRVGVRGPGDKDLVADPEAGPWETYVIDLRRPAGEVLTGERLLAAIGARLYVRTRSAEDLAAVGALRFEGVPEDAQLPLDGAVRLLEAAGWRVAVRDPRMALRPATAAETARSRGEPVEDER